MVGKHLETIVTKVKLAAVVVQQAERVQEAETLLQSPEFNSSR